MPRRGSSRSWARPTCVAVLSSVVSLLGAAPASADLVFFANGRTLSVKGHRSEGGSLVLLLRGGGEIVCDRSAVARIEPDEVPYPEETGEGAIRLKPDPTSGDPTFVDRGIRLQPDSQLQGDPRFDAMIEKASERHGVDATLVHAVIQVESNYEPRARSSKGARGLMQLMPETARQYGVSNLYDPAANIEAGTRHLRMLLDRFPLTLALAAYNAGEATVQRFGGMPPFAETRKYVDRILRLAPALSGR